MAIDERTRRHLHERLDATIGERAADALLEELTVLGRDQLATRHDIDLLRRDMDAGFAGLRGEMAGLRGEMVGLRGELGEGLAELRSEFHQQLAAQTNRMNAQTRQLMFGMVGSMLTVAAMAFGAAQLS
jgi:hypothetical protein